MAQVSNASRQMHVAKDNMHVVTEHPFDKPAQSEHTQQQPKPMPKKRYVDIWATMYANDTRAQSNQTQPRRKLAPKKEKYVDIGPLLCANDTRAQSNQTQPQRKP